MAIAVFDYAAWVAMFPEFAAVTEQQAQGFFLRACLACNNKLGSIVPYSPPEDTTRLDLLNLLVAHQAALNPTINPGRAGLVGAIGSATQGSVSISMQALGLGANAAYYAQTTYGLEYWNATARFRTMRYRKGPQVYAQPPGRIGPWRT